MAKLLLLANTAFISLVFPTLGQFINGRKKRALSMLCIVLLLLILPFRLQLITDPTKLIIFLSVMAVLWLIISVDACVCALKAESSTPVWQLLPYLLMVTVTLYGSLLFKSYVLGVELFRIPSQSMVPALRPGDFVLANTRSDATQHILPGDIVIFKHNDVFFIKRLIAGPSSVIESRVKYIRSGDFEYRINGIMRPGRWQTQNEEYFVVGDNVNHSQDSRHFGPIPRSSIMGKLLFKLRF